MKIGQRLNIGFALSFAMLALVVALGAWRLAAVSGDLDVTLNDHYRKVSELTAIESALELQSRHLRNALLQGDAALARDELDKADRLGQQAAAALEQMAPRLQLAEAQSLFGRLARTVASGDLSSRIEVRSRYHPATPAMQALIDRLAELYARQLVQVTTLIHAKLDRKAQQFANAFTWRKDA